MAKDKFEGATNDNVFGNKRREKAKPKSSPVQPKRAVGKPKIIPDSFKKVNFMLDESVIKKLRVKAIEEGESVNILLNRVISEYIA